jgi:hypothetical protein
MDINGGARTLRPGSYRVNTARRRGGSKGHWLSPGRRAILRPPSRVASQARKAVPAVCASMDPSRQRSADTRGTLSTLSRTRVSALLFRLFARSDGG